MFGSDEPTYVKELEWLANYYRQRGFKDKAEEILSNLTMNSQRDDQQIHDIFENEEEKRRA